RAAAGRGELAFGTVDAWLIWQLTGGANASRRAHAVHATDVSNASRTLLFDVRRNDWDDELLRILDVPREVLPAVHPSSHVYGASESEWLRGANPTCAVAGGQT